MPFEMQPIAARFRSRVELTIHNGFLATAGPLQCDPIARVHLVTVKKLWKSAACPPRRGGSPSPSQPGKRSNNKKGETAVTPENTAPATSCCSPSDEGGVGVTISARTVGETKAKYFTARPNFEETVVFDVEDNCSLTSLAARVPSPTAPQHANASNPQEASESVEDYVVVTVEDATERRDRFFGEAYCPFSPHCPSTALPNAPVRVMLQPRNVQDPSDPLFCADRAVLRAQRLDDFGFLTISWRVRMVPHGGAMTGSAAGGSAGSTATAAGGANSLFHFPLGLTLKARWQKPPKLAALADAYFTTSVDFGSSGGDRFVFSRVDNDSHDPTAALEKAVQGPQQQQQQQRQEHGLEEELKPLFLSIKSASQLLNAITFRCDVQSLSGGSHEVRVEFPLPSLSTKEALDRDVHWVAPVRTAKGDDLGLLFATIRLSKKPLEGNLPLCTDPNCPRVNDPLHQEEATHIAKDWTAATTVAAGGAVPPIPNAPFSAYQPLLWESQEHLAKAAERAWKRSVVMDAQPTSEHVRHLFDVLMGRVHLDAGVARVAAAFFNRAAADLTAMDLKEFMVACAFNGRGLSAVEAARFCFVALRRDVEDAVAAEEVHYLFLHALVGRTVDMSEGEIKRWVSDIIGDAPAVSFADFSNFVLKNEAVWAAFGVRVLPDARFSSAQHHHHYLDRDPLLTTCPPNANQRHGSDSRYYAPPPPFPTGDKPLPPQQQQKEEGSAAIGIHSGKGSDGGVWRTFVVRVPQKRKAFSVTTHVKDTVAQVKKLVEDATTIPAGRQEWRINGETLVDDKVTVGSTLLGLHSAIKSSNPSASASRENEVWIKEAEEAVVLHFVLKAKNKRWTEKVPVVEKVLKVRAGVQRHTLIPLSRCVLRAVNRTTDSAETVLADRHPISHYKLQSGDTIEVSQE